MPASWQQSIPMPKKSRLLHSQYNSSQSRLSPWKRPKAASTAAVTAATGSTGSQSIISPATAPVRKSPSRRRGRLWKKFAERAVKSWRLTNIAAISPSTAVAPRTTVPRLQTRLATSVVVISPENRS